MSEIIDAIRQRMSLREPLAEALGIVARLTDRLDLKKPEDESEYAGYLVRQLALAKEVCPDCRSFERNFPSFAFSIATGIGKTRLTGACIAYLYLKKGIKHFFVLAPNLTLYEKLKRDFGEVSYQKYAFKGIAEFAANPPIVVDGDNYNQFHNMGTLHNSVEINIFNISKFNSDSKSSKKGIPKMRRLSEYLGQSYFEYLSNLDDLVILMDEAHRYHADASRKAIDELRPVLGLEMTATPTDEKGKSFRNIVYEYNLAQALADGKYVKIPTVARRRNFKKGNMSDRELDIIKLEDAFSIHEKTKVQLELYSRQNGLPLVKPFIWVICRNIQHAKDTFELIENDLYGGKYRGKVLQIDSSTRKDDEVDRLFVSLESPDNKVEIVIHVNMLKEGWDVTNLYTIVPLRAADAPILIEQSIGRGLRLPYGRRTGCPDVDKKSVPKIIFTGFTKSYYTQCKFDSKTELDFANVLESDADVKKWLRPASSQFNIYWSNGSRRYEPDFVVETGSCIYLVETKAAKDVNDADVQDKKRAAEEYCKNATEYTSENGGKPWRYILLAHDVVDRTMSFRYLAALGDQNSR